LRFGKAEQEILTRIAAATEIVNLVIEAPLSVSFSKEGNPKGRSIEKDGSRTRYWYNGLGCSVMVAAMYLIRRITDSQPKVPVRLFEGFVSYKDRSTRSDHKRDVRLLRDVVSNPKRYAKAIYSAEELKQDPADELRSAFWVAGFDCGIPAVIKRDQT
jgi:hypothetical protein